MEAAADDSGIRKVLHGIVQAVWIAFCLFVLFVMLIPFFTYQHGDLKSTFPYFSIRMEGYGFRSVSSLQYFFALGFMHLGYLMTIVFTYYIKKILQNSIAGHFFNYNNVPYIKKAAWSFAYLVVCPWLIELSIYYRGLYSWDEIAYISLLLFIIPWTIVGVFTLITVSVLKRFSDLYEEQHLTI